MIIIKIDPQDGSGVIDVVVKDIVAAERLKKYDIAAGDAFVDQERWEIVRELMTHEQHGPNVGWTLGMVLPGNDPDDAIDNYDMKRGAA